MKKIPFIFVFLFGVAFASVLFAIFVQPVSLPPKYNLQTYPNQVPLQVDGNIMHLICINDHANCEWVEIPVATKGAKTK